MTDPQQDRDVPTLEDELLGPASEDADRAVRAEPLIKVPADPPWERLSRLDRADLLRGAAGFCTFCFVDLVMMYAPLMGVYRSSLLPQFVALLAVAFGLGGLLVWQVRGAWRPFGYGMMLAWVTLTLISVGFLTGVMR
ncbi:MULTISPECIES: hypothetical protein [Thermomonospora]|uniref:Uncharacterized protein n=1 Tax=Thermomonospora cellulosilytica TaxID=1411118 RepID=A0A7W3MUQ3_9ACTN|nr:MULTISPECIES: hypothetical protein [Thermomonospora]MBA9002255.1 hypothetical protein [Thermomonospora cellulosilytica]